MPPSPDLSAFSKSRMHRTGIPVVFVAALGAWGSCAFVLSATGSWDALSCARGAAICILLLLALCSAFVVALIKRCIVFGRTGLIVICAVLGILIGACLAFNASCALCSAIDGIEAERPGSVHKFLIVEDGVDGQYGSSAVGVTKLEDGSLVKSDIRLPIGSSIRCWQVIESSSSLKRPSGSNEDYCRERGVSSVITLQGHIEGRSYGAAGVLAQLRDGASTALDDGEESGAFLKAILVGDRSSLHGSSLYADAKTAGLAHIVAVSGAHVVIVMAFAGWVLGRAGLPRRLRTVLLIVLVIAFVLFAGMPRSAIRAGFMAACALNALFVKKRSSSLSALSVCLLFILVLDPFSALSVSLALSAGATIGIVLFGRLFSSWVSCCLPAVCPAAVSDALGLTLAANLFTLPLTASLFSQVPLVSPLSNVIVAPLFSVVGMLGIASLSIGVLLPFVGSALLAAARFFAEIFCQATHLLASIPFASIPVQVDFLAAESMCVLAAAALYCIWPQASAIKARFASVSALFCIVASLLFIPAVAGDEIVMIDVGQGDAIALRSGSSAILVDTGTDDAAIKAGLARHGIVSLDAVFITHPDDDHCGSLGALLDTVPVGCVCVASDLLSCPCRNCAKLRATMVDARIVPLECGQRIVFGPFALSVLWPSRYEEEGGNGDSLVMGVDYDGDDDGLTDVRALLTGDAEAPILNDLIAQGSIGMIDILKVGHHGSRVSLDEASASVLCPRIALISVGALNRYGHPTDESLACLDSVGATVFRTDQSGDISCRLRSDSIAVDAMG